MRDDASVIPALVEESLRFDSPVQVLARSLGPALDLFSLYPIAPGIYAVASALILINALVTAPNQTGWGALIIALGIPIYFLFSRR